MKAGDSGCDCAGEAVGEKKAKVGRRNSLLAGGDKCGEAVGEATDEAVGTTPVMVTEVIFSFFPLSQNGSVHL